MRPLSGEFPPNQGEQAQHLLLPSDNYNAAMNYREGGPLAELTPLTGVLDSRLHDAVSVSLKLTSLQQL